MPVGAFLKGKNRRLIVFHGSSDMSRLQLFFTETANGGCLP